MTIYKTQHMERKMKFIFSTIIFSAIFFASSCNKLFSQACTYDMGPYKGDLVVPVSYSFIGELKPQEPPKPRLNYTMVEKKEEAKKIAVVKPLNYTFEDEENTSNNCVGGNCSRTTTYTPRVRFFRIFR